MPQIHILVERTHTEITKWPNFNLAGSSGHTHTHTLYLCMCAGICGSTSLSFKGAIKAERFGLIKSILTLNDLNFSASCDEGGKYESQSEIKLQKPRMRGGSGSGREESGESLGWGEGTI